MSDLNEQDNVVADSELANKKDEAPLENFADLKLEIYSATQQDKAEARLQEIMTLAEKVGVEVEFGFDTEEDVPEGYSIAFIPETLTIKNKGRKTIGMLIATIPDTANIWEHDGGAAWISKNINLLLVKAVKAVKTAAQAAGINPVYPQTISQFIVTNRTGGLAGFNKVAPQYVDALKELGLTVINKGLLRQVLSSASFAESQFPNMPQEQWVLALKAMIETAEDENLSAGVMADWLKTRDEIKVNENEFDLSGLGALIAKESHDDDSNSTSQSPAAA